MLNQLTPHRDSDDEAFIRALFEAAMDGAEPSPDIQTTAIRSGRKLRTRRLAVVASGAVAASLLVGAAAPWLVAGSESPSLATSADSTASSPKSSATPSSDAGPGTASAAPSGTPSAGGSPSPGTQDDADPEHSWQMPAFQMIQVLRHSLPRGVSIADAGSLLRDTPGGGPARGVVHSTLAKGDIAGDINVLVHADADPADNSGAITCPGNLTKPTACTEMRDDTGKHFGRESVQHLGDVIVYEVVRKVDGGVIYAAATNTVDDKWDASSPITAPEPLLTVGDLWLLVANPSWRP